MNNYRYTFAYKGKVYRFESQSKDIVLSQLIEFHQKNNIIFDREKLSMSIDRQSKMAKPKKKVGIADAVVGAKALLRFTSGEAVSGSEMERRASICSQCPHISLISGCRSCGAAGAIAKLLNAVRAAHKLQYPIPVSVKEKYCSVCDCSLALMVPSKISAFAENDEKNGKRPDNCWIKRTSQNYINE